MQAEALAQVSQLSGRCHTSSPEPCLWEHLRRDWGRRFYIRLDVEGCFHTYPDVGGPFKSLPETTEAIDRYLEARRDPKMCEKQDKGIRGHLYWPDGTVKRRTMSEKTEKSEMRQLVQALVDKYNEDHNLFEDLAHELKDVLHYQSIIENLNLYYHFNFKTKIKGAGPNELSMDNLFFVEVKFIGKGKLIELQANCFCAVNPDDNGPCFGCTKHGDVGMKHPSSSVGYTAGHLNVGLPFGFIAKWKRDYEDEEDDDKYVKAKEAELRQMFKVMSYLVSYGTIFVVRYFHFWIDSSSCLCVYVPRALITQMS
ncbi:hypothetical protein BDA96_07G099800 [Sorghum bicolor]|uniref:DUF3615 domain-containing protein n=4 Tax=Sorghum bicolor TaxID=4558 RepID=A0A921QJJ9_SORBI|nr:hypothetical protein BDA96_07G099800 [Sorghum bicolor]KXG24846.1 hypothetical protein SORBI_3007G093800 [Sorghum bicolor]